MEIKKIYIDMDGVLADFDRGVEELCHLSAVNQSKKKPSQDDMMFAAMRGIEHFYDKLEVVPGAKKMFEIIFREYGNRCEILSGIPKPKRGISTAGEDKVNWIHRLFSPKIKVNTVYREDKMVFCKGPEYVLIDDYEKNINEWESRGGTAVLFTDSESTIVRLKELGILQ